MGRSLVLCLHSEQVLSSDRRAADAGEVGMSAKRRVVAVGLSVVLTFVTAPEIALAAVQGSCP
jgi:hypothetical protein